MEKEKSIKFYTIITKIHGDSITLPDLTEKTTLEVQDFEIENDDDPHQNIVEDPMNYNGKAILNQPYYDLPINSEVLLSKDDQLQKAVVVERSADENGEIRGTYSSEPIHNTIMYDVAFNDGTIKQHFANIIAMNILDIVMIEGCEFGELDTT